MSEATAPESPSAVSSAAVDLALFDSLPLSPEVKAGVASLGLTAPSELTASLMSAVLSGRDVLVRAVAGPGKTAAYGMAIAERLPSGAGKPAEPACLVVVPTRELAQQIATQLRVLGAGKALRVQPVYGGAPVGRQAVVLKGGVDVVVGTPGRLLDHIRRKNLALTSLRLLVLDEADEVLSMGFWDQATQLLGTAPAERQMVMLAAGMPHDVAAAVQQFLRDPLRVEANEAKPSLEGVRHVSVALNVSEPKPRQLLGIIEAEKADGTLIFCSTRSEAETIASYLTQAGLTCEALPANPRHRERERIAERIRSRELRVMVSTDVAVRDVDLGELSHLINYSVPQFSEAYAYRAGRIGRAGKTSTSITLVDAEGAPALGRLAEACAIHFEEKSLPPEQEVVRARSERIMKELAEKASVAEVTQQLPVAQQLVASPEAAQIVAYLLKSYFGVQAADAERKSQPPSGGRPMHRPNRNGSAEAGGEELDNGRGRRRRRRRGRRGDRGESSFESNSMSASEALAGNGAPESDPSGQPAREVGSEAAAAAPLGSAPSNGNGNGQSAAEPAAASDDGMTRLRVNIGFDDGFKGRGAVAKRIAALAGLTEGTVMEVESRREYSILKASARIAELVIDRVDGTPIGKKTLTVSMAQ